MAMRFVFNPDETDEHRALIVTKPSKPLPKLSELPFVKKNDAKEIQEHGYSSNPRIDEIIGEIDSLVGLTSVKNLLLEIRAYIEIQKKRKKENLLIEPMALHMIFKGNPGTGKTTIARIIGCLFKEMGVLEKGHLIEVERADLVGEYIGHTAQKTRAQIKKALGGILFIDEAYSLARGGEKDFGKEAIDTMVKNMEENKDNLVIILAGYKNEMHWFLETNPGLRSRFPIHIDFPDYLIPELLTIADIMVTKRQYQLTKEAKQELEIYLQNSNLKNQLNCGNARFVRNIVEKAIRQQALRLINNPAPTRNDLILLDRNDILGAFDDYSKNLASNC